MIAAHVSFLFPTTSVFVTALNKYAPGAAQPFDATLSQVPMVGTAPAAEIYALRAFDPAGRASRSRIMAALERVIQLRELYDSGAPGGLNIRVCNMSFAGSTIEPGLEPEDQLVDQLLAHDIVPVVAAANAGPAALTIGSPASSRSAIAVGAANLAHNQRVAIDVAFGSGIGALYRPFDGTVMAFFSSRGPDADGRVQPNVVANGWDSFGMGGGGPNEIEFAFGTSFSTPTVSGIAAVLRQKFPAATARQIRNAIIASANPTLVNAADVLDQGHGYVNAAAAASLLAGGSVPDTVAPEPNANQSVKVNVEQNTPLKAVDGFVRQTLTLQPGQRHETLYRVLPNTSQVIVSLSNFSATLPPNKQNQFFGDDVFFGIHSAKTSAIGEGDYLVPLDFVHNGTWIVNNPEAGLMRISVNGDWTNAGNVSVDVSVMSLADPVPQFTSQGKIMTTQLVVVPFTVPAGTGVADLRLSWKDDWSNFPTADVDLILVSPTHKINLDGATLNNPEKVSITNPEVGNWIALIDGFEVPAGTDKYEFRVALDGKVVQ